MAETLTHFAPPERAEYSVVRGQSACFTGQFLFRDMLDHVPDMVMVLNSNRQIVYANLAVLQTTSRTDLSRILGLRPGELFHCKHAAEAESGCGTTQFCKFCGAVNAILRAQNGNACVEECRLIVDEAGVEQALDLRVWSSPLRVGGAAFTLFIVANIADEKRRFWLEKIFLHDLMNTATALQGFSWLLSDAEGQAVADDSARQIAALAGRIISEIESHRQLVAAENNELALTSETIRSSTVLQRVYSAYANSDMLNGRRLSIDPHSDPVTVQTDPTLLVRVVGNMVKNGLESSAPGEMVTLGSRRQGDEVEFWVHNPTYMPENVRLQVFNRSFSTKGRGRGLGTYSMKLLSERYLQGRVSFTSSEERGTTFSARYPLVPRRH